MSNESLVSAHPIEPAMREQILGCLTELEQRHDVTVLFACESGSRGWGFASPDSDYDVRFIYVNRLPWYLTVEPGRDVIEEPISGALDVNGWDLRKALELLRQSNPTLLEWLRSPIVYREDTQATARLRELAEEGFSPVRGYYHYVSMAKKNFREHLRGEEVRYKKYLYVLRPLLAAKWIREDRGVPPMRFAELAQAALHDRPLIDEINRLLEVKMRAGEAATSPRWDGIHAFIESELAVAESHAMGTAAKTDTRALDECLHRTVLQYEEKRKT
jgi:predicted nucleotidyltransferase